MPLSITHEQLAEFGKHVLTQLSGTPMTLRVTHTSQLFVGMQLLREGCNRTVTVTSILGPYRFNASFPGLQRGKNCDLRAMRYYSNAKADVAPTSKRHFFIAVLDPESGQPLPAQRPVVKTTLQEANDVAVEMARKHAGQTFVVYQAVASHTVGALVSETL